MDEQQIETLARLAGLDQALAEFRADVMAAAKQAADLKLAVGTPPAQFDEPWPPMRPDVKP
jgi:hypothetical protein